MFLSELMASFYIKLIYVVSTFALTRAVIYELYGSEQGSNCTNAGFNDTCILHCDPSSQETNFNCGLARDCYFYCEHTQCLKDGTLDAASSVNLYAFSSAQLCYENADVYTAKHSYFKINGIANREFKKMSVHSSENAESVFINCTGSTSETCRQIIVNAQSATSLEIVARASSIMQDADIHCPENSNYTGPNIAPCSIDFSGGGIIKDGVFTTINGIPKDIMISGELTGKVSVTCTEGVSRNNGNSFQDQGDCWNTDAPTSNPTLNPSIHPSVTPTSNPSINPTQSPTKSPTVHPTQHPTQSPTNNPTQNPTNNPTLFPTKYPTKPPTLLTSNPTAFPSKYPTKYPTLFTSNPTQFPSKYPTIFSTFNPSLYPTLNPSLPPSYSPTKSILNEAHVPIVSTSMSLNSEPTETEHSTIHLDLLNAIDLKTLIIIILVVIICILATFLCIKKRSKKKTSSTTKPQTQEKWEISDNALKARRTHPTGLDLGNSLSSSIKKVARKISDITVPHAHTEFDDHLMIVVTPAAADEAPKPMNNEDFFARLSTSRKSVEDFYHNNQLNLNDDSSVIRDTPNGNMTQEPLDSPTDKRYHMKQSTNLAVEGALLQMADASSSMNVNTLNHAYSETLRNAEGIMLQMTHASSNQDDEKHGDMTVELSAISSASVNTLTTPGLNDRNSAILALPQTRTLGDDKKGLL